MRLGAEHIRYKSYIIIMLHYNFASVQHYIIRLTVFNFNKTPAKAFTPPAESKMGTRPGRAVTRELIGGGVYSLISVLPN